MRFDLKDSHGAEVCSVTLTHLWADVYGIVQKSVAENIAPENWLELFTRAIDSAMEKGAGRIQFRLIEGGGSEALARRLPDLGFQKKQNRIEFQRKLSELPTGIGSPIHWKTAKDIGFSDPDVANLLSLVATGDPDSEPSDDPLTYIQDWLKDPVLTSGLECIGVGLIATRSGAFVVAQVNPKSKWSRISYMGIAPEFRGKGLGLWVHRHGFDMMRAQGGELYHGGTSSDNLPMLKLFERHGCEVFYRMQEWTLTLSKGALR
jgi:hypothetical protein